MHTFFTVWKLNNFMIFSWSREDVNWEGMSWPMTNGEIKNPYEKQFPSQDIKENVLLSSYLDS